MKDLQRFRTGDKLTALGGLVHHCDASQIQHLKQLINPLLQRDFIALLPREVAFLARFDHFLFGLFPLLWPSRLSEIRPIARIVCFLNDWAEDRRVGKKN